MRQKRAKVYRKLLSSYIRHFGLRPPLQVLIDAPMALTLAGMKLSSEEVPSRLATVLQVSGALPAGSNTHVGGNSGGSGVASSSYSKGSSGLVKLMITQCSITELYKIQKEGDRERRAVELAKQWERRFCNHKEALPGDRCLCEVIGDRNKHRYVLAAGSSGLRFKIRNEVVGVPVVHANDRNVMVMEPMSELTRKRCDELERKKLNLPAKEASVLGKRQAEGDGDEEAPPSTAPPPRKKKAKGPNPLSMRKPKKAKEQEGSGKVPKKRQQQQQKEKGKGSGGKGLASS